MVAAHDAQTNREMYYRCCDNPFDPRYNTMREIHDHKTSGLNQAIKILALDNPGSGGANHVYALLLNSTKRDETRAPLNIQRVRDSNGAVLAVIHNFSDGSIIVKSVEGTVIGDGGPGSTIIWFQNGPIKEAGFNGLTGEALIAVQIDRMRGFQHKRFPIPTDVTATEVGALGAPGEFDFNSRGKFASRENACSLTDTETALMWLQKRTRDREARGVEGTHAV